MQICSLLIFAHMRISFEVSSDAFSDISSDACLDVCLDDASSGEPIVGSV